METGRPNGGIDEAGRGPVLGPLVVAAVAGDPTGLHGLGARDSKMLQPGARERLARHIRREAVVFVETIAPAELDARMEHASLNDIELAAFGRLAKHLEDAGCEAITVDAADVDAARFGRAVQAHVAVPVHSRHKADRTDPCVAAASIVAKVERDQAIRGLARRLERELAMELGSGYPSDPKTKAFLAEYVRRFRRLPEGTRQRWSTARALLGPKQGDLRGYEDS